jgi:predicted RNase H-like HicB family nuclease
MRYPVLIEPGTEAAAFGVVVPDLPGCFSAGDTLDEALDNAREAIALWIDTALDKGWTVPSPSSAAAVRALPGHEGWMLAVVEVDDAALSDTIERVNITLPRRVLGRLDALAAESGRSRGAVVAELTLRAHALRRDAV